MLVFAREVFVCKCATDVRPRAAADLGADLPVRFARGTLADLDRLDRRHHGREHLEDFAGRLGRGEHWLIGEVDGAIATYTWLHQRDRAVYPSLPGCEIALRRDTGYGYDAWTDPALRGRGLRRAGFVEELGILRAQGLHWEASFFVKYQLEGARRSLAEVGIEVVPLWRLWLGHQRRLEAQPLAPGDDVATPLLAAASAYP